MSAAHTLPKNNSGENLYDRIWNSHRLAQTVTGSGPEAIYIDLHLLHEGTYLQAFGLLAQRKLGVRRPDLTVAVTDHYVPSDPKLRAKPVGSMPYVVPGLIKSASEHGIAVFGPGDARQGIVHVIGPDLGLTQPGMTVVCGDSHTSTHGALGALGIGVGTTQVGHVLATQCLLETKQRALRIDIAGDLSPAVTAKDLALHILARHGVGFGRGYVIEFAGTGVAHLSAEARMTLCNMAIEMGSRSGVVSPDRTTLEYLYERPRAPRGEAWDAVVARCEWLASGDEAHYDHRLTINASDVKPMVSYGTTPGMSLPIDAVIPAYERDRAGCSESEYSRALEYMGLSPGERLLGRKVSTIFLGSCTNSRIEDLRGAARILRGHSISPQVDMYVVPGSMRVKRQAEAEGLAEVFVAAGARWLEPGCSMCLSANGDVAPAGQYTVSTSNRNFENRQGKAARTMLASPLTAAASAIYGYVADPRERATPGDVGELLP